MKVLITGANGFLGSWLTKRLLAEGHQVRALIRRNSDLTELSNTRPEFFYGDVTDKDSLFEACKNQDALFHLAGVVSYKKSDRALMENVNVQGTLNVIEVCEKLKIPDLLYLSSVVAIGSSFKQKILNENDPYLIHDLNLGYFETKHSAEKFVIAAAKQNRIKAVCVNPSTIYGFGDAKKGSRKNQIKVARGKLQFYPSGGVNVVAVEDVIEGILLAFKKGRNAERYILSSENILLKELFKKISYFANSKEPQFPIPNWALHTFGITSDLLSKFNYNLGFSQENAYAATLYHWFDNQKAINELGCQFKTADYAIENSVRWMKDNGYLNA